MIKGEILCTNLGVKSHMSVKCLVMMSTKKEIAPRDTLQDGLPLNSFSYNHRIDTTSKRLESVARQIRFPREGASPRSNWTLGRSRSPSAQSVTTKDRGESSERGGGRRMPEVGASEILLAPLSPQYPMVPAPRILRWKVSTISKSWLPPLPE